MAVTLPYHFDTSPVVKVILRGVLGLLVLVALPGVLYSLFISRDLLAAVALLLVGGIVTYFGVRIHGQLEGSQGRITTDAVVVSAGTLYGIPLAGPTGRFPTERFETVRVELISSSIESDGHERVYLQGVEGTPDILVARTDTDAGRALGRELSAALHLRYEETRAPY
jgi:hypothetical protein